MSSFFCQPIYAVNEGFKADMDVTMSAISDFKPITYLLDSHSKAGYIHPYIHIEAIVQFACSCTQQVY